MARPTKEEKIPNLQEAIMDAAWQQIAEKGAAALSLRAIARRLGITAPAIYNYFSRRDDLVTALIVDAFTSLGESQMAALHEVPGTGIEKQLYTLGLAYRDWSVNYPQRYQLIFGTPIPNYHAPAELTLPAAAESLAPLINAIQIAFDAGRLRVERYAEMTPELKSMLEDWSQFARGANIEVLYTALIFWTRVHGIVSMEIGNQLPSFITDPGKIFRRELNNLLIQYFNE